MKSNIQHRTPNIETKGVVPSGACKRCFGSNFGYHPARTTENICRFALRADLVSSRRCKS